MGASRARPPGRRPGLPIVVLVVLIMLMGGAGWPRFASGKMAAGKRGPAATPKVAIVRIGQVMLGQEGTEPAAHVASAAGITYYYCGPRESIGITVSSPLPPHARLYPLVRQEGAPAWRVQAAAVGPGGGNGGGEWTAEVQLGKPVDAGMRFELMAIVAPEALPPVPLPEVMRAASTLAESAVVPVERRRGRPSVAVAAVGGSAVYGSSELMVHDREMVDLVALDLPGDSRMGVAVRPDGSGEVWVMPGATDNPGSLQAEFGEGDGSERSFHYKVSGFAAWPNQWPPAGRPLSDLEWQSYQLHFVGESRPVPVVRWRERLQIEQLGTVAVRPGAIVGVERQLDIHGAAGRPLASGESILIVCVPEQGEPWIAGGTSKLTPSGHWSLRAVQLQQDGKPERFDVLAVVSKETFTQLQELQAQPGGLRRWLADQEGDDRSTRVAVVSRAGAAAGGRPGTPGGRP